MNLHEALVMLRENGPLCENYGICGNVALLLAEEDQKDIEDTIGDLSQTWPKFSGYSTHPVPHPKMEPFTAYRTLGYDGIMWDRSQEYGSNRWELLDYLIEITGERA